MDAEPSTDLNAVRDAAWESCRRGAGKEGWVTLRLGELLEAAEATILRELFAYTSHNTLNFSRCSSYPFTHDCPWILFTPEGRFVSHLPDPGGAQGNVAQMVPPVLVETSDPSVAVAAVIAALPPQWQDVWIGSVETRFRFQVEYVDADRDGFEGILVAGPVLQRGRNFSVGDHVIIPTAAGTIKAMCTGFPLIRWGQERRDWISITVTGVVSADVELGAVAEV